MVRNITPGDEIPKDILAKAEKEIELGYRELSVENFKGREKAILRIFHPDISAQEQIASCYAEAYNNLLTSNTSKIITRKQMSAILEKKGIWGKLDDEKTESIKRDITDLELRILTEKRRGRIEDDRMKEYQSTYIELRNKLLEHLANKEHFFAQTIESRAEEASNLLKLILCVRFEDGSYVWENIESLKKENNNREILPVVTEAYYYWSGLSREILDLLPESIFSQGEPLEQSREQSDGNEDTQSLPTSELQSLEEILPNGVTTDLS
jgi:hypothetical protein